MAAKKGSKSYFYRYLKSFMLILIVPFLTILLVYFQSQSIVREMTLNSSRNALNQYVKRVDEVLKGAAETSFVAGSCKESKDYSAYVTMDPDRSAYRALLLKNRLYDYCGEIYEDVFVYFPKFGKIVSGANGSMEPELYCDAFYGKEYWNDFRDMLEMEAKQTTICKIGEKNGSTYLCVLKRQSQRLGLSYEHMSVTILRRSYLSELMNDLGEQSGSSYFMLFDSEERLLFSSVKLEQQPEMELKVSDWYETDVNGQKCIVQVRKSEELDIYYTYAVPYSHYWNKLETLRLFCGLGGLISLLLGLVLAWTQTHRVYRPVGKMLGSVQGRNEIAYDAGKNSEFEFIEQILQENEQEILKMESAIHHGNSALRTRFLADLLEGRPECGDVDRRKLEENGVELCSTMFQVAVIEVEKNGGLRPELLTFAIENVINEICSEKHKVYMVPKQNKRIAVLLNVRPGTHGGEFNELIQRGKTFLEERCKVTFTGGISTLKGEIGDIPIAYIEACRALNYGYLLGKGILIEYADISERTFRYLPPSKNKLFNRINGFLAEKDGSANAEMLVKTILADYEIDSESSLETVECFKIETISELNQVVVSGGYRGDRWEESVRELFEAGTHEEFVGRLSMLLEELLRKQQVRRENEDVCQKAYDYIHKNYADTQLSLKFLSDKFGISSSYLSRLFYAKYYISVPDLITGIRCKYAKEELENTDLSIREIAERNGFLSADTFIKAFKKIEGVTPGGYRKQRETGREDD